MQYAGRVVRKLFAKGSKSERLAVMLITDNHEYILRHVGVAPYNDPALEPFVDKKVLFEGVVVDYTLFIEKATILQPAE